MRLDRLSSLVAVDTETTGLRSFAGDLPFAIAFCDDQGQVDYVAWAVDPLTRKPRVSASDVRSLQEFFRSGRTFVFHHGKFDVQMLTAIGVHVPPQSWEDTLVAMRCLITNEPTYGLKPLAKKYADYPTDDEEDLLKSTYAGRRAAKQHGWSIAPDCKADYWLADPVLVRKYALGDVKRTMLLWMLANDRIKADGIQHTYDLEMRVQPVVIAMERRGVRIDRAAVDSAARGIAAQLAESRRYFDKEVSPDFNPNSHLQKCSLFETLGIRPVGWTSSGQPSWKAEHLAYVDHPVAEAIVHHADLVKRASFFESWAKHAVCAEGIWVLYPNFEPQAARTGRFGCRAPNLQQVPKRDPEMAELARRPFIPREGCVWIAADYSQMELRMLADLADESEMRTALAKGRDIHRETAVTLWGSDAVDNDPGLRSKAKGVTFGIQYGIGAKKLGKFIGGTEADGLRLLDQYLETFSGIRQFREDAMSDARNKGYVRTAYGRRLDVPPMEPNKAVNYRIQGSGADVCKRAMIAVDRYCRRTLGSEHGIVLTIHDELAIEVPRTWATAERLYAVRDLMESAGHVFKDRLPVDVSLVESSWAEKLDVHLPRT
jgi:DNA polymerase-1